MGIEWKDTFRFKQRYPDDCKDNLSWCILITISIYTFENEGDNDDQTLCLAIGTPNHLPLCFSEMLIAPG